jgi:hypothetical protein
MPKTAPFDRSGTPPSRIVAEVGFARLRSHEEGLSPQGTVLQTVVGTGPIRSQSLEG